MLFSNIGIVLGGKPEEALAEFQAYYSGLGAPLLQPLRPQWSPVADHVARHAGAAVATLVANPPRHLLTAAEQRLAAALAMQVRRPSLLPHPLTPQFPLPLALPFASPRSSPFVPPPLAAWAAAGCLCHRRSPPGARNNA